MRPTYLNKKEVPSTIREKLLAEEHGDKALWKMFNKEVLMEQELATSEENQKVK